MLILLVFSVLPVFLSGSIPRSIYGISGRVIRAKLPFLAFFRPSRVVQCGCFAPTFAPNLRLTRHFAQKTGKKNGPSERCSGRPSRCVSKSFNRCFRPQFRGLTKMVQILCFYYVFGVFSAVSKRFFPSSPPIVIISCSKVIPIPLKNYSKIIAN